MKDRAMFQRVIALILAMFLAVSPLQARYVPRPHSPNFFSVDQEVQAGKQYSTEVQQKMPMVTDAEINNYVERLGQRLAAKAPAKYPYTFKVVNQKEINAFALPGGPVFVNLGTIQAADNEAQLAGVMAHEISHVVMRHSTNQASKQMLAQLPLAVLGGRLGGGMLGQLAQLGLGFGVNSIFMKYSRDAEREADLVGAGIMHDAGYNPQAMVDFFRKLEQQGGSSGGPQFLSDHPNPGNRVEYVAAEVRTLSPVRFTQDSGEFQQIKRRVAGMKPLTAAQIQAQQGQGTNGTGSGTIARTSDMTPSSSFKTLEHVAYTVAYPSNWQAYGDQNSTVTIAPNGGVSQDAVAYGVMINGFEPEQRGSQASLDDATHQLLNQMRQSNPDLRQVGNDEDFRLNGYPAKSVMLLGVSPLQDRNNRPERERDWLVVTQNRSGVAIYFVFIAPDSDFQQLYPTYNKILRSVRLK